MTYQTQSDLGAIVFSLQTMTYRTSGILKERSSIIDLGVIPTVEYSPYSRSILPTDYDIPNIRHIKGKMFFINHRSQSEYSPYTHSRSILPTDYDIPNIRHIKGKMFFINHRSRSYTHSRSILLTDYDYAYRTSGILKDVLHQS